MSGRAVFTKILIPGFLSPRGLTGVKVLGMHVVKPYLIPSNASSLQNTIMIPAYRPKSKSYKILQKNPKNLKLGFGRPVEEDPSAHTYRARLSCYLKRNKM